MGGVLGSAWGGVLKLVERLIYISWYGNVHYADLVVPFQCDAAVKTPCPIQCYLIFFLEFIY